jgi:hypothetical protein
VAQQDSGRPTGPRNTGRVSSERQRVSASQPTFVGSSAPLFSRRRKILTIVGASFLPIAALLLFLAVREDSESPTDEERSSPGAPSAAPGAAPRAGRPPLAPSREPVAAASPPARAATAGNAAPAPAAGAAATPAPRTADAGVVTRASRRDGGIAPAGQRTTPAAGAKAAATATPPNAGPADAGVAATPDAGARAGQKVALLDVLRSRTVPSDMDDGSSYTRVDRFVASGGAVLVGKIVDIDSGRPVSGSSVEARFTNRLVETATDATGGFRMPGMAPDSRVVVWVGGKRDHTVAERLEITIPGEGKTADLGVIKLLNGDELGSRLEGWIGLWVTRAGDNIKVSSVNSWVPAHRAGIAVGDVILSVDGRAVKGLGPRSVGFLLRGPTGSSTTLEVQSSDGNRRKLTLERIRH